MLTGSFLLNIHFYSSCFSVEKEAASEATGSTCQEDQDGNTADRSNAEQNTHLSSEKPTHVGAEEGNAEPPYLFECKI